MDIKDGLSALLPVARSVLGLDLDVLRMLGPADLTILFTDIENHTGTTDSLGDAAAQDLLRTHNTIVRRALKDHGGHETKHTGDGIMAYFLSASRAIAAAIDVQREIAAYNAANLGNSAATLSIRIGLNAGEPILEDGDLYGTPVIVAARVADAAGGGQILVADVVRQLAAGKGFVFRELGRRALQGISEPVELCEIDWTEPEPTTALPPA